LNIDVISLVMGIIIGIGMATGAFFLRQAQGYRVIYRVRQWRSYPRRRR
jgi:hypothetical protein